MVHQALTSQFEAILLNPDWNVDDDAVYNEIGERCSAWIIDIAGWHQIKKEALLLDISVLPEIVIFEEESIFDHLSLTDVSYNVSFIPFPCSESILKLNIEMAVRKTKHRFSQKMDLEKYKGLFSISSGSKMLIDPVSHRILEANPAVSSLLQIPLKELYTKSLIDLHNDLEAMLLDHINKASEGNKTYLNVKYQRNPDDLRELEYFFNPVAVQGENYILVNIDDITEREKANELYYQQAEMLKNTIESIDDQLFSLNREGDFLEYYKPSGGAPLTTSGDVFIGKNIYDVGFPLDVAKKYLQAIDIVTEEDHHEQIDYYLEAFGSRLWYNARISPRKNAFGEIEGVTVLCRDVTRQKKNEETLKKARDFYLTLLADFPSMIWKTNSIKKADYFNKTWLEFTGNELEDEIKSDWNDKIHYTDLNNFRSVLANAYKTKQAFLTEHRLKHYSGEYRWVINAGRPFYNLDGQFSGFIGSCYDISERRKAEEMLYLQKAAMESALEGILIIQNDNRKYPVIYANRELSRLTGTEEAEIIGQEFLDVLGCPLQSEIRNRIIYSLNHKTSFKGEYICVEAPDEEEASWRLLYIAPVKDKKENTNYFVALLSDITDAKKVESTLREKNKQLEKTNQELDSFVYSTSHELRSPLMSVLGLLNLMETDIEEEEKATYLGMIRESISRLDNIIHDIIDYSRNSRIDIQYERIDFEKLIEKILQNYRYVDHWDKIRFSVNISAEHPFLSDRKRIQVIINNFISNSLRFHDVKKEDSYIEIVVNTSPVSAIISISDNGTGIHEKHLPRIYEMFYRGTEKSKGSGIGLYIVKEIVEKLSGKIMVESEPGKGTTFKVEIPNYVNRNYKVVSLPGENTNKELSSY